MSHAPDAPGHGHGHAGPNVRVYLIIFAALTVFTLVSFVANYAAHEDVRWISVETAFIIILGVAVVKAVLVAAFFMHLMWDWGRVYFMIVPVLVLGTMMMVVLLPDIVLAWKKIDRSVQGESPVGKRAPS